MFGGRICLGENGSAGWASWGRDSFFPGGNHPIDEPWTPRPDEYWGSDPGPLQCSDFATGTPRWSFRAIDPAEYSSDEFDYEIWIDGEPIGYWSSAGIYLPHHYNWELASEVYWKQ